MESATDPQEEGGDCPCLRDDSIRLPNECDCGENGEPCPDCQRQIRANQEDAEWKEALGYL